MAQGCRVQWKIEVAMAVWMAAALHGAGRRRDVVVERFGHSVEHQPDAHAGGEHHRDPGNSTEFGFFSILAQRDVAELAQGQPQDKDHEERGQEHEQPSCVLHDPVQGTRGSGGKTVASHEAPDNEGNCDDACNSERDLVEAELMVPAIRNCLLGLGMTQLLEDLLVLFDVRQDGCASVLRIEDSGVCVYILGDSEDCFTLLPTSRFFVTRSLCHTVVSRQLLGCMGFRSLLKAMSGSFARCGIGLRLSMALGSQTGRRVGGLVRFGDHDVAFDNLHFVRAYQQLGQGVQGAPLYVRGLSSRQVA
jgi:hypothetical protein